MISSVAPALTQEFAGIARRYLEIEPRPVGPQTRTGMAIHTDYPSEGRAGFDFQRGRSVGSVRGAGDRDWFWDRDDLSVVSAAGDFEGVAIARGWQRGGGHRSVSPPGCRRWSWPARRMPPGKTPSTRCSPAWSSATPGWWTAWSGGCAPNGVKRRGETADGGLAELIAAESNTIELVEPNLTLIGLGLIFELNKAG